MVKQVSIRQDTSRKDILILDDNGQTIKDTRFYSTFTIQVIVQKEKTIQTAHESLAFSLPMDDFFRKTDPETAAKRALERALLMIEAPECPAGEMPVILSGEAGGTMIHEACGHGLEADIIQKDFSVYRNSIGKKVASENVTLIDDGTIPTFYGTLKVDDEGTVSQRTVLIEKGILKNYLTDRITSRQGNLPLSGNGRRSSYRSVPIPRMTNTYVAPGNSSQTEMISNTEKGLLVKKMGGGEVNPTSGDFVFQVTEGYLIENGQIRYPVRGALLTGNGPKVLEDIQSVGNDLSFMPGVCGKSGQNIPVTDGQPSLYIKNLIVGGKETEYEVL
jgi:TldD protein